MSLQTYQLRASVPGRLRRARLNQGCWSEVWLITSSVMTRRPRRLASVHEAAEVLHRAEVGIDAAVVGDVVAVVAAGAGIERQQPERGDAEVLQIVELLGQAGEIADAVVVAVGERLDVQLIDDRVLVPQVVVWTSGCTSICGTMFTACAPHGSQRNSRAGSRAGSMRKPHAAPFDGVALAGDEIRRSRAPAAVAGRADHEVAEVEPELRGPSPVSAIATRRRCRARPIP